MVDTAAFHLLDVPVAWTDAQGLLRGANPAFEAITGYALDQALGQPLARLLGLPPPLLDDDLPSRLRTGLAFSRAAWRGCDALGQPLAGHASMQLADDLRVVTLHSTVDALDDATERQRLGDLLGMAVTLADIAVWHHDQHSGLLHTSDEGWALLGLTPQAQGRPLSDLVALLHPDDLPALRQQLRLASAGHEPDSEASPLHRPTDIGARCRMPDGRWRYLLTRHVARRNAQGVLTGHVGVALDLTERFDQQQRALALSQRLEMATSAAGVGVWSLSMSPAPVVHWDAQMRALHALAPDQPPPAGMADYVTRFVHEADRDNVSNNLKVLFKRKQGLLEMDLRIRLPDGRVRRLATRSAVDGAQGDRQFHGVMIDVTERHASEERLRQAHERAALAARGAGIGTWESDAEANLGWWDDQMFRLRGREPVPNPVPEALMLSWLHPSDVERHHRQMRTAVSSDTNTNVEFRVVLPDGTVRWLASRSTPVHDEVGRTVGRIGINWDITDARNAALERAERQLAQRESQAKSRLLARISHELRTPLNAVLGFSQLMLADGADDTSTWRRRVELVQASGEHLLALIDDVLDLSSLESGELPLKLQPVALARLVETTLPLVEPMARSAGVTLHCEAMAGWVHADPVRLRQVLLNLLSNAIKYNRPQGRVTLGLAARQGWLSLQVRDTGRGLSADQLQHVFEPFNRLGQEREGTIAGSGIGLAIAQASMRHMGGELTVTSTQGEGSCFEVHLQAAMAPAELATQPTPAALPPRPSQGLRKLLYIEDNEVNLLIVSELMRQRSDLDFLSAEDGTTGIATAKHHLPHLILLDMQLPDMDGHEVLQRLRQNPQTAAIPCIALSANAMTEDIQRAREAGFADYWTKPLDLKAFLQSLEALFGAPTA